MGLGQLSSDLICMASLCTSKCQAVLPICGVPKNSEQMTSKVLVIKLMKVPILAEISNKNQGTWLTPVFHTQRRLKMATSISVLFKYARKSKGGNKLYLQVAAPEWSQLDFYMILTWTKRQIANETQVCRLSCMNWGLEWFGIIQSLDPAVTVCSSNIAMEFAYLVRWFTYCWSYYILLRS